MFKTVVSALLCLTLFATAYSCNAARLALVIGNDAYESHAKLKKAGNDADAMATLLKQAGFTVVNDHLRRDLSRSQMNTVFAQLVDRVRVDDEVVVFFSGHGLQYGDNSILTGKDFPKKFGRVLAESEGISLYSWQDKIKRARARFALFIVDACREDVGDGDIRKSLSGSDMAPLAPTTPPKGQIVIFATSSGQFALDRTSDSDPSPNGVFTRVFVQEARKPGASIIDVLGDTEELVVKIASSVIDRSTGQPYEQQPAIRNEAGQRVKFCFFSANGQCGFAAFATNAASSRADAEEEAYALAKTKNSRVAWQALLNAYPNGRYAPVAAIALSEGTVSFSAPPQPLRFPSNGYSKVSNAGAPLSDNAHLGDAATDWACTRDNASGLTWEVKTSLGLRSSIHTYTWFDSQGNASAKDSPSGGSCWKAGRCDTERYTRDVNSVGLCGARDWRMPTADELKGLVRQSRTSPMIDQSFFPNTVSLDYWSSSPDPYDSSAAWSVYFANGSANSYSFRSSPYSVRLVRAGP